MHLRRALLLFALVLGLTAIAASVAPPPTEQTGSSTTPATPPPTEVGDPGEQRVGFHFPAKKGKPVTRKVEPGRPVVVFVSSAKAGQATIPPLGRVGTVTPEDPARFDLLLPGPGRFEVEFTPAAGGESRPLGMIVAAER